MSIPIHVNSINELRLLFFESASGDCYNLTLLGIDLIS